MTDFNAYQPSNPQGGSALLVGAASPLWGFFAAAAASGLAFWWMTRWTRPINLEALYGAATPVAPDAPAETPAAACAVLPAPEPELRPESADEADLSPPVSVEFVAPDMTGPEPAPEPAPPALDLAPEPEMATAVAPEAEPPAPQADFAPPVRPRVRKPKPDDAATDA